MPYKFKTTKRNTMWTVQIQRKNEKKKEGRGWQSLVDDHGPIVFRTRKVAREINREFRNTNPNDNFRVVKIDVT